MKHLSQWKLSAVLLALAPACAAPLTTEEMVESELVGREQIIGSMVKTFDRTGRSVRRTKILDPDTMMIREVAHDHGNGAQVAFDRLAQEEKDIRREQQGVADDALAQLLDDEGESTIDVAIEVESVDDVE